MTIFEVVEFRVLYTRPNITYITWPTKTNGLVNLYTARNLIDQCEARFALGQKLLFRRSCDVKCSEESEFQRDGVAVYFPDDDELKGVIQHKIY